MKEARRSLFTTNPTYERTPYDQELHTTKPVILLVVCNVTPLLIGPSEWVLIMLIMYHVGEGNPNVSVPRYGERTRTGYYRAQGRKKCLYLCGLYQIKSTDAASSHVMQADKVFSLDKT